MAYPDPYDRQFSFTDFARTSPTDPLPGLQVDTELNAVKIFLDLLLANTKLIQRADGALQNGIVGLAQIAPEVQFGLNDVSDWQTGTQYFQLNGVWNGSVLYRCLVDHISSADFSTDLSAGRWVALVDFTAVLADAVTAQTAAETAQTAAELAETNAETAQTAAELAQSNAETEAADAATQATAAATSATAAAQSEVDVATAIATLVDPTTINGKFLKSDGTDYVATNMTEDEFGNVETFGNVGIGNDLSVGGYVTAAKGAMFEQTVQFTASGTYTKPVNLKFVIVETIGGGGGAGGAAGGGGNAAASGGGGGGYSRKKILADALGATETVTIGAGGLGGNVGLNNGAAGGTSSFGAHNSATGGNGGLGSASTTSNLRYTGGNGGEGSSGDLDLQGNVGGSGVTASGLRLFFGYGGAAGGPYGAQQPVLDGFPPDAEGYGNGGSGGIATGTNVDGGAGSDGLVLVHEHF